ncbi:MAG: PepSY domain-containing protein [Thermoleophilaceae bacterium]|nr:PepSY domain-containing protein [Thermoleophilaceae bacterium]
MDRLRKVVAGVAALAALALGGAAIAGAAGGGDDSDQGDDEGGLSAKVEQRARVAALRATGGGRVNAMERDGERGAAYEVEVRKPDGSQVDVRLDESFGLVAIDSDRED